MADRLHSLLARLVGLALVLLASCGAGTSDRPEQRVTIYVRGADAQTVVTAQRPDLGTITLTDPGVGVLTGSFTGTPVRFVQLELLAAVRGTTFPIYDGLIVLSDANEETLAFQFDGRSTARRVPVSPSARIDLALDERATWWVGFGWGALALGWVGLTGILWALKRRRPRSPRRGLRRGLHRAARL